MNNFNKLLILFLFPLFSYSQSSMIAEFNIKSKIYWDGYQLDTINIIKADIKSKFGNFSLQLIDFNKNNIYNDFGVMKTFAISETSISKRPDGFYISKYKDTSINLLHEDRFRTLNNTMFFMVNGHLLKLFNLVKKSKLKYTAIINSVKLNGDIYSKTIKNNYLAYTDKLNSICIKSIKNKKSINIKKLLKNKYLYIKFIDADLLLDGPSSVAINYMSKYYAKGTFENIDVIYIIVNSSKEMIDNFNTIRKLEYDVYYLDEYDYKNRLLLGCNNYPQSSLFNKKGDLVKEYVFPFDLDEYEK